MLQSMFSIYCKTLKVTILSKNGLLLSWYLIMKLTTISSKFTSDNINEPEKVYVWISRHNYFWLLFIILFGTTLFFLCWWDIYYYTDVQLCFGYNVFFQNWTCQYHAVINGAYIIRIAFPEHMLHVLQLLMQFYLLYLAMPCNCKIQTSPKYMTTGLFPTCCSINDPKYFSYYKNIGICLCKLRPSSF